MNKKDLAEWLKVALLTAIAISGIVTANQVRRIARTDFEVELTGPQIDSLLENAERARVAALEDLGDE